MWVFVSGGCNVEFDEFWVLICLWVQKFLLGLSKIVSGNSQDSNFICGFLFLVAAMLNLMSLRCLICFGCKYMSWGYEHLLNFLVIHFISIERLMKLHLNWNDGNVNGNGYGYG